MQRKRCSGPFSRGQEPRLSSTPDFSYPSSISIARILVFRILILWILSSISSAQARWLQWDCSADSMLQARIGGDHEPSVARSESRRASAERVQRGDRDSAGLEREIRAGQEERN